MSSKISFPKAVSLGATMASVLSSNTVSQAAVRMKIDERVSKANISYATPIEHLAEQTSTNASSFSVATRDDIEWTKTKERHFTDLLTLKALKKADTEELEEFKRLQKLRRRFKNPMSAEEIVFQYKKQQMAAELRKKIEEYIMFTNASSHP